MIQGTNLASQTTSFQTNNNVDEDVERRVAMLDDQLRIMIRERVLAALHNMPIDGEAAQKLLKIYQKTVDQELKAKALRLKELQLAQKERQLEAKERESEFEEDAGTVARRSEGGTANQGTYPSPLPSSVNDQGSITTPLEICENQTRKQLKSKTKLGNVKHILKTIARDRKEREEAELTKTSPIS